MPRRPPHFKAFVSAKNHRKLPGIAADDAVLAMWLRAGWMCIERFADRTQDTILVTQTDLGWIANTAPWVNVQKKLRRLVADTPLRVRCDCAASPLRGRCDCAAMSLEFPNFAEKHGFKGANGTETGPHADADADADRKRGTEGGPIDREPHAQGSRASIPPDPSRPPSPGGTHTQRAVEVPPGRATPRGSSTPTPEAEAAFDLLLWAIEESMPGASIPEPGSPRWKRWCQELDRLHSIGEPGTEPPGWSWSDIGGVLRWLPTHVRGDFRWGLVIRSASNLRKHFARLLAEAKSASKPTRSGGWRAAAQSVHKSIMETGDG